MSTEDILPPKTKVRSSMRGYKGIILEYSHETGKYTIRTEADKVIECWRTEFTVDGG